MASKATINRQKSAEKVIAACDTHKGAMQTKLSGLFNPEMGDAAGVMLNQLSASLRKDVVAMVDADDANEAELQDDDGVRRNRDVASEALYTHLCTIREQLGIICGPTYVSALGFKGRTPEDPVAIVRLTEVVLENFNALDAPTPVIPGYSFDASIWTAPLEEHLGNLKDAISNVAKESREAEATLMAKREAIANYDQTFSRTASLVSTLLEMSGESELAKRVRPSVRRPGQTVEDAETKA